jgi:DNA-binding PadR family transcriptional regulator
MRHHFLHGWGRNHHHAHSHDYHFGRHGHRGFAGFGFGPGQMFGGDLGRSGLGAGRKLSSRDLQLLILSFLAERPHHGYELIKSIAERSSGYYSPSPGMVYPALTYLEEIGHATVEVDGAKKRYTITPDGLSYLEANRASADTLLEQLAWIGQRMEHVRRAFDGGGAELEQQGDDFDAPRGRGGDFSLGIRQARRNLKAALVGKFGAGPDEQSRIAGILERAAREIRGE